MPELVLRESCTGNDNDLLSAHTSDTGHTWTKRMGSGDNAKITNANRVTVKAVDIVRYYSSFVPPSADYSVVCDVVAKTIPTGTTDNYYGAGALGRLDPSDASGTFYQARVYINDSAAGLGFANRGQVDLYKFVAGVVTQLGSNYNLTLSVDTTYKIELSMVGSAIKVYLDGTERISATDTAITAAGRPGIVLGANWGGTPNNAGSNTVGLHLDNILMPYRATAATPRAVQAVTRAATR